MALCGWLRGLSVGVMVALAAVLAGCEGDATPLPVDLPAQPTETPVPAALPALQYGLAPNVAAGLPLDDFALIAASGVDVVHLPDEGAYAGVDVAVRYGAAAGVWLPSDLTVQVSLVLALDAARGGLLVGALNPAAVVADLAVEGAVAAPLMPMAAADVRTALANMGYPDGFGVTVGTAAVLGAEALFSPLSQANIDVQLLTMTDGEAYDALMGGQISAALIVWGLPDARERWAAQFGADNVIDLYTLPVSYVVGDGLKVAFSARGFPLVTR